MEKTNSPEILIHARFAPDGSVTEIGERPVHVERQKWFNFLIEQAAAQYQVFAGGRGVFRLSRAALDSMKTAIAA